ncbi:hypothetical protein H6G11_07285 [Cyanobacterium aponinum FACHB-4101]|uniref:hypothetical protein n=1 Tax=Cyanobacterium aponinum TaxID=379064 RepID=UPI0016807885|nr:hypothetical protein [Cyanobacterium aponinum]MBD2394058.1 hypothetical protein [Cyanobacterium aponinum FACHB-4101]
MRAYEFTTDIQDGNISIPIAYVKDLNTRDKVRVIILTEDENKPDLNQEKKDKLSDYLLIGEIDDYEDLFKRDKDTGREIDI